MFFLEGKAGACCAGAGAAARLGGGAVPRAGGRSAALAAGTPSCESCLCLGPQQL